MSIPRRNTVAEMVEICEAVRLGNSVERFHSRFPDNGCRIDGWLKVAPEHFSGNFKECTYRVPHIAVTQWLRPAAYGRWEVCNRNDSRAVEFKEVRAKYSDLYEEK